MSTSACSPFRPRRPLLAALALTLLLPAAPAAAGTLSTPAPVAGDVTVLSGTGKQRAKLKVAKGPKGVAVFGAVDGKGRFAVALVSPKGAKTGAVKLKAGGRLKASTKLTGLLSSSRTLPATACVTGGPAAGLRKVIRAGALSAADAKAVGAALQRRACGQAATSADTALFQRVGLKVPAAGPKGTGGPPPPAGGASTGGGKVATPSTWPGGKTPPAGGGGDAPGEFQGACKDGKDNDGDGQTDARGEGTNPDPGCMNGNDASENSEKPVSAECAQASGVSAGGDDPKEVFAAVNSGCGSFVEMTVSVQPGILTCTAMTGDNTWSCANDKGVAWAFGTFTTSGPKEIVDMPITLTGPVDCTKPATIALHRADLTVEELVEPVQCKTGGGGTPDAQCANGLDDDGDGQTDAPQKAGVTDPDPGCTGTSDTSESSEIAPPIGCDVQGGFFGGDTKMTGLQADGCGSLTGAWFKAPGTPQSCVYRLEGGAETACTVTGPVGMATFPASTALLKMITPLSTAADCRIVTIALQRSDGQVIETRGAWC
ncbi:MAG: hypothetical protein JHC95_16835 [Solirubrobacteraceae bacterium]|nr:hypothetical protein [Solirubrobacteraceae bacterium]